MFTLRNDRYNLRFCLFVLSFLLVLRHHFFYQVSGEMLTEFGTEQHFISYLTVPVTSTMAMFFLYNRQNLEISNQTLCKLFFLCLVAFFYSFMIGVKGNFLTYDIFTSSRRPVFLILFPIFFSFLAIRFLSRIYLLCFAILIGFWYYFSFNFTAHYILLFLATFFLSSFVERSRLAGLLSLVILCVFIGSYFVYPYFRLNILPEFFVSLSVIVILFRFSKFVDFSWFRYSLLDFYVAQAVFFTLAARFFELSIYFESVLVFILAVTVACMVKLLED